MEKLTNLDHLRQSAARSKELIGEVAQAAAQAVRELAEAVEDSVPVKEVTQAEYDALSAADKQAATVYILPDGEGSGGESETPAAGVLSFNGRRGDVVPRDGDYTAKMVGADPVGSAQAALKAMLEAMKGIIPSGVIWIWNGAADAVPEGWALCDGSNGTPDLRGEICAGVLGRLHTGERGRRGGAQAGRSRDAQPLSRAAGYHVAHKHLVRRGDTIPPNYGYADDQHGVHLCHRVHGFRVHRRKDYRFHSGQRQRKRPQQYAAVLRAVLHHEAVR